MKSTSNYLYAALAAAVLVTTYLAFPRETVTELEFHDRKFPPGMRDLVLARGGSAFDPALGPAELKRIERRWEHNAGLVCRSLYRDVSSPSSGASDSPLQIVTFLDYRCPYCKTLSNIMGAMQDDNLRIVYREWPILGDASTLAARAALAADRQGKYLPLHNKLMNSRLIPTPALIDAYASELGMDIDRLHADMKAESTLQPIRQTAMLATALGLTGTPSLVVGRTIVQGEITRRQLETLIADERKLPPIKDC